MPNIAPPSRRRFLKEAASWSALAWLSSHAGFAAPPRVDPAAHHALILGDWGWSGGFADSLRNGVGFAAQSQVAQGMQHYVRDHSLHPEALLMLGDSWYGDLPQGARCPRWSEQFERMYPLETFACPAYSMLGNHDYQFLPPDVNKVEAELEYARTERGLDHRPTRFTLPARWYTFDFPASKPLVHFIVLDSNMPHADGSQPQRPDFTLTPVEQARQLAWLSHELEKPRLAPFLAVLAHHPIYSNGPHGDHPILIRDWAPLFRKHKVDVYMAGHDHDLQVLQFVDDPTTHFLSGGGGADLYNLKITEAARGPYALKVHGFSHLSATPKALELRHLNQDGRFLYGISRSPDGRIHTLQA